MSIFEDVDVTPEEYFKRVAPEVYTLAKFLGTKEPFPVYTIRKMRCDCFAGRRGLLCKHVKALREWISKGRPLPQIFVNPQEKVTW